MSNSYSYGIIKPPTSSCYSNLSSYGVNGAVKGIVAPTPVSAIPGLFSVLGSGHSFAKPAKHYPTRFNYPNVSPLPKNCSRYLTMSQSCEGEFDQMYSKGQRK